MPVTANLPNKTYLKFIDYKNLKLWDVKRYAIKNIETRFRLVSIREFVQKYKYAIQINDVKQYKRIRIKAYGKGVEVRDIEYGKEIKTKQQFLVKAGQFIFSKIDARNGAFGIVPVELDNAIITNSFSAYNIDRNITNIKYLYLVVKTKYFQDLCEKVSSGTTGRRSISDQHFINFQIPLPPLSEQNAIVENYFAKINKAHELERENAQIKINLEQVLFSEIREEKKQKNDLFLKFVEFAGMKNWSVSSLLDMNFNYSTQFPLLRIGDFIIQNRNVINIDDEKIYNRVKVKINSNGVVLRDTVKRVNIGTKKQYVARSGQFIVSKIDARNGAFGIIPKELNGAIVTNDFPLFDVDTTKINPYFLPFVTTTQAFIKFAQSCSSGTTNRQ